MEASWCDCKILIVHASCNKSLHHLLVHTSWLHCFTYSISICLIQTFTCWGLVPANVFATPVTQNPQFWVCFSSPRMAAIFHCCTAKLLVLRLLVHSTCGCNVSVSCHAWYKHLPLWHDWCTPCGCSILSLFYAKCKFLPAWPIWCIIHGQNELQNWPLVQLHFIEAFCVFCEWVCIQRTLCP